MSLPPDVYERLGGDGESVAETLAELAADHALLRESVARYAGRGGAGPGGVDDAAAGSNDAAAGSNDAAAGPDEVDGSDGPAGDGPDEGDPEGMAGDGPTGDVTSEDGPAGDVTAEGGPAGDAGVESVFELPPPIAVLLGFESIESDDGRTVLTFQPGPEHANPMGTLHGGVLCDVGDAAMGTAYASTLAPDESFATVELDVKFLRPVWDQHLTATAEVVHRGRTTGLVECDVVGPDGELVARLNSVCTTLRGDRAAGR